MSEVTEPGVETAQNDHAEMDDLMAGYNARSGNPLPADVPQTQSAQPESIPANEAPNEAPGGEQVPQEEQPKTAAQLMAEQLAAFKEEVRAMTSSGDSDAVRRLHGEIGNINRTLKQLEPKPAPAVAPVDEELTAAMQGAEKVTEDFPEFGGPLVAALKAVEKAGRRPQEQQGMTQEQIEAQIEARANQLLAAEQERQRNDSVKVLKIDHPDYDTVMRSKEFDTWVNAKPADLRETIIHTENPLLAARFLTEFKESQRAVQQKQNRLASAVTPKGVAAPPAQSKLTDDEQLWAGYKSRAGRRI